MVKGYNHVVSPVTIAFSEEISDNIFLFGFKRPFDFTAGQVVGISLEENGPRRLYSICSGEDDEKVQILYNIIGEGYLTPLLSELQEGDRIWITGPRGEFTCSEGPAVWIAAGTGIAPFYSMLRSGLGHKKILIYGNRYLEQFHFFEEFRQLLGQDLIRCCSAETETGVYHGRVTDYLKEAEDLDPGLMYYICGSAEMVVDTRDLLIYRNVPYDHIVSEIYF